jgi:hypothetical protein
MQPTVAPVPPVVGPQGAAQTPFGGPMGVQQAISPQQSGPGGPLGVQQAISPQQAAAPPQEDGEEKVFTWEMFPEGDKLSDEWVAAANASIERGASAWAEFGKGARPSIVSGMLDLNELYNMQHLAAKVDAKKATQKEVEEYYTYIVDAKLKEKTFGDKVAGFSGGLLAGLVDVGSGVGAASLMAKGAAKIGIRMATDAAWKKATASVLSYATKIGATVALSEAVPRALNATGAYENRGGMWSYQAAQAALGSAEFTEEEIADIATDMEAISGIIAERGGTQVLGALMGGIEIGSEYLGGPISKVPGFSHVNALLGKALNKLAGKSSKVELAKALGEALQYQGPLVEDFEELVANVGQEVASAIAMGEDPMKASDEAVERWVEDLPAMTTAFSIVPVGGAVGSRTIDSVQLARGKSVKGREGIGEGSAAMPGDEGFVGPVAPEGPIAGAPTLDDATKRRAAENFATAHKKSFREEVDVEIVEPTTPAQRRVARIMAASKQPAIFVRNKSKNPLKARGYFDDKETQVIVLDADSPLIGRTAFHEIAHAQWQTWDDRKREEFTKLVDSLDSDFLDEAKDAWVAAAGVKEGSVDDFMLLNEAQATGAENVSPVMEFAATERGRELLAMAEGAKPGTTRRVMEFLQDFLRAFAGKAPKAPTTALKKLQGLLGDVKSSDIKIAKAYEAAWNETIEAVNAPAADQAMGESQQAEIDSEPVHSYFDPVASALERKERLADEDMTDEVPRTGAPKGGKPGKAKERAERMKRDRGGKRAKEREKEREKARERGARARDTFEREGGLDRLIPGVDPATPMAQIYNPEGIIGAGRTSLFADAPRMNNDELREHNKRHRGKLLTRKGREQIADELESFLDRLYRGQALPTEAKKYIAALRGEGQHKQLAEEIQEARMAVEREERRASTSLFARAPKVEMTQLEDGRWEVKGPTGRVIRVNKGVAEQSFRFMKGTAGGEQLISDDLRETILDADVNPNVERAERRVIKPKNVKLSEVDTAFIAAAGEHAEVVEGLLRSLHANFPESAGWVRPIPKKLVRGKRARATSAKLGDIGIEFEQPGYGFNVNQETGKAFTGSPKFRKERDAQIARIGNAIVRNIRKTAVSAAQGDPAATTALRNAAWYTSMVDVIRNVFGGAADMMVDLLGALSPNTPVPTNWRFAVDFMRRLTQGHFDVAINTYAGYVDRPDSVKAFRADHPDLVPTQESGKLYGFNSMNALHAAYIGAWRMKSGGSAPKAKNFSWNLTSFSDDATVDVWAARYIARMAGQKRLSPASEKGLSGKWDKNANYITGEFGFGQEVLQYAADRLGMKAKDLQAVAWFIEKDVWARNNWTTKQGEGGSFEHEDSKGNLARVYAGVSMAMSEETQGEDYMPTAEDKRNMSSPLSSVLSADSDVMSSRIGNTIGRYYGSKGEVVEKSFDIEVVTKPGFDPATMEREVKRIAKQYKQESAFMSRVLRHDEEIPADARPAMELYFQAPLSMEKAQRFVEMIRAKGLDGFTFIRAQQVGESRSEILEDPSAFIGVRLQAIHEFYVPDQFQKPDGNDLAGYHKWWEEQADSLVRDLAGDPDVFYTSTQYVQTVVFFKDSYDENSGQASRAALARGGKRSRQRSGGSDAAAADSVVRNDGREGGAVGDVSGGDTALFARVPGRNGVEPLPDEPPPDHVRIYRGISAERSRDAENDPTHGLWFVTSERAAREYANWSTDDPYFEGELLEGSAIVAMDVHIDDALRYAKAGSRRRVTVDDLWDEETSAGDGVEMMLPADVAREAILYEGDLDSATGTDAPLFARRKGGRYRMKFAGVLGEAEDSLDAIAQQDAGTPPPPRRVAPGLGMTHPELEAVEEATERARVEGDQTRLGRPGLNNPGTTPEARAVVRGVGEERGVKMTVRRRSIVLREAEEGLEQGGQAARAALARKLEAGDQLTDTETVQAAMVLDELAAAWLASGSREDFQRAALWEQARQATRTAQARALGVMAGRGLSAAVTLAMALAQPTRTQDRKLRRIRRKMNDLMRRSAGQLAPRVTLGAFFAPAAKAQAARRRISIDSYDRELGRMVGPAAWTKLVAEEQAVLAEMQASTQRGLAAAQAIGYSPAALDQVWTDPIAGKRARAAFGAGRASFGDKLFELRYASILSGIRTHIRNTVGNAANFSIEGVLQPTVEGVLNLAVQDPNSANWDEGLTFMKGARGAIGQAVENAWKAWRGDMPVLEIELAAQGVNLGAYASRADAFEVERVAPATDSALATALRKVSLSLLLAADEFWKTMAVHGQSLALATRIARGEGHTGSKLDARIQALLADKEHPLWTEAVEKARKITFQDEGGRISREVVSAAHAIRGAVDTATPYIFLGTSALPFVNTPTRIFANVIRRSPLNIARFMSRVLRNKYRDRPDEFIVDAADAAIAGMMLATVFMLMYDDDDEQQITGSRPANRGKAELNERLGAPPLSVKVGGRWYSFKDIEPLSTSLGIMADSIEAYRKEGTFTAFHRMISSAFAQAEDKTFVRTIGDLRDIMHSEQNREGKIVDLATYAFITPWMPNAIKQPIRAMDDYRRQKLARQDGESIFVTSAKNLPHQFMPIDSLAPPIKYDLWGRAMRPEASQTPTPALVRLLSPVLPQGREGDQLKADLFLRAYNERAERGELGEARPSYPATPSYTFSSGNKTYRWTPEEYSELTKRAGEQAAKIVTDMIESKQISIEEPDEAQFKAVDSVIKATRRAVSAELKARRQSSPPAGTTNLAVR